MEAQKVGLLKLYVVWLKLKKLNFVYKKEKKKTFVVWQFQTGKQVQFYMLLNSRRSFEQFSIANQSKRNKYLESLEVRHMIRTSPVEFVLLFGDKSIVITMLGDNWYY